MTDARGLTSTGQVTVTVTGENDPPQSAGIPDVAHAAGGPAETTTSRSISATNRTRRWT